MAFSRDLSHVPEDFRVGGFRFSAGAAGIRRDGRDDVGLIVASEGAIAAGVFTRNLVRAAPVVVAEQRLRYADADADADIDAGADGRGLVRGILVNSGCANACTGQPGEAATLRSTAAIARALGVAESGILPASTGVIGALLPAERIEETAATLVQSGQERGYEQFARAILTTDRWPKVAWRRIAMASGTVNLLVIAKGAGMIHPDLGPPHATMLAFAVTDAVLPRAGLCALLARAVDDTLNACSVDGDTSTNDSVFLLASGASGLTPEPAAFEAELQSALGELARSMVADGEGANHLATIRVVGLATRADARQVAKTIATSLLVKTALHGKDINWGRLLAAAGRAGVAFDPSRASLRVGEHEILREGLPVGAEAEAQANAVLQQAEYELELCLGDGPGRFAYLTSDLGHGYVDVNAGYRS